MAAARVLAIATLTVLVACGPAPPPDPEGTSSDADAPAQTSSAGVETRGSSGATSAASTGPASTSSGDVDPSEAVCRAYADRMLACFGEEELHELDVQDCLYFYDETAGDGAACEDAIDAFWTCVIALSCQELKHVDVPCLELQYDIIEQCPSLG